jgi:adenylyl-sulfate kinase
MAEQRPDMQEAFTVLLTGLPGSGKSTLGALATQALIQLGRRAQLLDGEQVRATLSRDLGFDRAARRVQAERLAFLAGLLNGNGVDVVIAAVTPFAADRAMIAETVEQFVEVAVVCDEKVCRQRDIEGLYERANEIEHFTGVNDPYEPPDRPDAVVVNDQGTPEQGAMHILKALEAKGLVRGVGGLDLAAAGSYSQEDEDEIAARLRDLGYL